MTTRTQQRDARRRVLPFLVSFLAALVAVLATLLSSASASAATQGTAETRVRASASVVEVPVGPPERIAAGQRLGNEPARAVVVLATGVAAKACSFTGSTVVLMADGSKKPIANIEVGDEVMATDPETGDQEAKTVEYVYVHHDTVTDLVVDGEVITTTEDHPFWSATYQRFERADELDSGEEVLDADGRLITVSGLKLGTAREALAYNLAVEGIHTFHVGQQEILVHNNSTCGDLVDLTTPKRRNHILNGDKTGGGHRSEFPAGWSDDRIMHEISDIATAPGVPWRAGKFKGQRIYMRGGIEVLTDANGNIISAWVP